MGVAGVGRPRALRGRWSGRGSGCGRVLPLEESELVDFLGSIQLAHWPRRGAEGQRALGDVPGDHAPGTDDRPGTDGDPGRIITLRRSTRRSDDDGADQTWPARLLAGPRA